MPDDTPLAVTLEQLIREWRKREVALCRKADAQPSTLYAQRLAAEAEGIVWCADHLAAALAERPQPQEEQK